MPIGVHAVQRNRWVLNYPDTRVTGNFLRQGSAASLAAEAGIVVLKVALQRWGDDTDHRDLAQHIRESLGELKALAGG